MIKERESAYILGKKDAWLNTKHRFHSKRAVLLTSLNAKLLITLAHSFKYVLFFFSVATFQRVPYRADLLIDVHSKSSLKYVSNVSLNPFNAY